MNPKQCRAMTKQGTRCRNPALPGSRFCHVHQGKSADRAVIAGIGGAILGNLIFPGAGGVIAGAILGALIGSSDREDSDA